MKGNQSPRCGGCGWFDHEDVEGFGECRINKDIRFCGQECVFLKMTPTTKETIAMLHEYQKWRRGGKGSTPAPKVLGIAIDNAIRLLRDKRKKERVTLPK